MNIIDKYTKSAYRHGHEYSMKFYANQAKVPTIAHPKVKFKFKFDVKYDNAPKNFDLCS